MPTRSPGRWRRATRSGGGDRMDKGQAFISRRLLLLATLGAGIGHASAQEGGVDLALVLAVDVSRSIDEEEARLQREGYRNAMADPAVIAAITGGTLGAIGVAYLEWAAY